MKLLSIENLGLGYYATEAWISFVKRPLSKTFVLRLPLFVLMERYWDMNDTIRFGWYVPYIAFRIKDTSLEIKTGYSFHSDLFGEVSEELIF